MGETGLNPNEGGDIRTPLALWVVDPSSDPRETPVWGWVAQMVRAVDS